MPLDGQVQLGGTFNSRRVCLQSLNKQCAKCQHKAQSEDQIQVASKKKEYHEQKQL